MTNTKIMIFWGGHLEEFQISGVCWTSVSDTDKLITTRSSKPNLATLPAMMDTCARVLWARAWLTCRHIVSYILITNWALCNFTIRNPIIWPCAIFDNIDWKFKCCGQTADGSIHSLSNLPDLDLIGFAVGHNTNTLNSLICSHVVAWFANTNCCVSPTSIWNRSLVVWACRTESFPTSSAVMNFIRSVKPLVTVMTIYDVSIGSPICRSNLVSCPPADAGCRSTWYFWHCPDNAVIESNNLRAAFWVPWRLRTPGQTWAISVWTIPWYSGSVFPYHCCRDL